MIYKPHRYQEYCIDRVIRDPAVALFLRPGLGKTSITLTAIHELKYHRWQIRRVLVVAPKKVAEGTWSKEAVKWDHLKHLRVITVLGSEKQRLSALKVTGDVYVINRENVPWLVALYGRNWPFDMVVLDESTSFKNPQSKRFKAMKLVRRFCKKVVILTGTPSSRGIMDLWAQIYLLDEGKRLGRTIGAYRDRYFTCNTHGGYFTEYVPRAGADREVLDAISDICVSMSAEDYLELPECIEHEVPVILDPRSKKKYAEFERECVLEIQNAEEITASTAAVLTGKLLQFCAGAIYDEDKNVVHVHDCKIDAYMELIEQLQGEPCITFYGFQHDRDRLLAALREAKLRVRLYEGIADEEAWNAGEVDVLLVHPASCAYGLNLQAGGRHVVWFTPSWSFELNDQGVCRLWRQGSPYDRVIVHYLIVQGGVDEDVLKAIRERQTTHEVVMNVLKARLMKV